MMNKKPEVSNNRRYDIDALRVIAIGLLIIYHTSIGFQGWGIMIGFISNDPSLPNLWAIMAIFNIWRIPLLFFISGMGVYFALQNRTWNQLFLERGRRILIPFILGIFILVPVHNYIFQSFYGTEISYLPNPGHLWFLGNILLYILILFPLFAYFKKPAGSRFVLVFKKLLGSPFGLLMVILFFMIEVAWAKPAIFELYAMTWHGFFLGLLSFFFGFCFVMVGSKFWEMLKSWRYILLILAIMLLIHRFYMPQMKVNNLLLVLESNIWIFTIFAFGYKYLNKNCKLLKVLSPTVYPIYMIHMIVLYSISSLVFPIEINVWLKFIIVIVGTFMGCFICYYLWIALLRFIKMLT
ncbi:acyltransferase family protein [Sphingobacterium lactis]|uniref:acyltransferase family protein n=1 Tax=Sphingobacterium lactis TaxID=797291 RepID=UPI003F804E4F